VPVTRAAATTAKPHALAHLFATVSLGAPENAVGFMLWRLVHRYQREVDRALAALELTHLQFMTLILAAWLGREGETVTQTQIARAGDIQPMQISHMLKTLEEKALIARVRNATDVRAKRVEVTTVGLVALRRALPLVITVQHQLFGEEGRAGGGLLRTLRRLNEADRD
jgi:DNA-binding MarR family transcriptional regulator